MKVAFYTALLLTISAWTRPVHCSEPLTRELLKSLPGASKRGLVPVLEVGWSTLPVDQFSLSVQLQTLWRTTLFNPIGDGLIGCPYLVILTDSDWNPVYQVMNVLPANQAIPEPKAWIEMDGNRVIGRKFWRHRDWTLTSAEVELPPHPAKLTEGSYLLHLLVTERLETEPPFGESPVGNANAQALWRTEELDRFACRSQPVPIRVGADGKIQRPESEAPLVEPESPIKLSTTINKQGIMTQTILITDKEHEMMNPGLRGMSFDTGIRVKPPVEDVRYFMNATFRGKSYSPDAEDYRRIPKDAILGVRRQYFGPLDPGEYEVSVKFPSNLWQDQQTDPAALTTSIKVTVTLEQLSDE